MRGQRTRAGTGEPAPSCSHDGLPGGSAHGGPFLPGAAPAASREPASCTHPLLAERQGPGSRVTGTRSLGCGGRLPPGEALPRGGGEPAPGLRKPKVRTLGGECGPVPSRTALHHKDARPLGPAPWLPSAAPAVAWAVPGRCVLPTEPGCGLRLLHDTALEGAGPAPKRPSPTGLEFASGSTNEMPPGLPRKQRGERGFLERCFLSGS